MPQTVSTAVDLSRLPAPTIVPTLGYEAVLADLIADLQTRLPGFDALLESDPAMKILEVAAYRELLIRRACDDGGRQTMIAYASGANLDQLAALVLGPDGGRLVLDPGDPDRGIDPTYEDDDALRRRVVLAPESWSVAGPELAYVFHAKSADGRVADASATSPAPGEIVVAILATAATAADGTAPPNLLDAVSAIVDGKPVRPLGDAVTVQSADVVPFDLSATLYTFAGPDTALVLDSARGRLGTYLADSRRLGRDITTSSILAALTVAGVQRVELAAPAADIVCDATQAAHCTQIAIAHGGYAD